MAVILLKEIEKLRKKILAMSTRVEEKFRLAVKAAEERDTSLAENVMKGDYEIDEFELDVEEECLRILALYQPVAIDLRYVTAIVKINKDLERIGDLAAKIARKARALSVMEKIDVSLDFSTMTERVREMLEKSLNGLIEIDVDKAFEVCEIDDEVDAMYAVIQAQINKYLTEHPEWTEQLMHYVRIADCVERIADHAGNIAEELIYIVEGTVIKHNKDSIKKRTENKFKSWVENLGL
jgi:phosphate transport system protein